MTATPSTTPATTSATTPATTPATASAEGVAEPFGPPRPHATDELQSDYTGTFELEFEKPLIRLEKQIAELEDQADPGKSAMGLDPNLNFASELRTLRLSHTEMLKKIYAGLDPWKTVQVARHPGRPQSTDYIDAFVKDFTELHGDRAFGDDPAIRCGLGRIGPHKVMLIAHRKGRDTREKIRCHFGCAHPEGYRKALRCMKLAEKFGIPVVTLVDTQGAYPGIGAEERGQAEAIAVNLREMSRLRTPILSVIIGEGGSGGAIGIGVADRLAMLQYAWYSVISPEGCAAILWKEANPRTNPLAAKNLKLTARDNLELGTIDAALPEPLGGAHRRPGLMADMLEKWLIQELREFRKLKTDRLLERRYKRLRSFGRVEVLEEATEEPPTP